jgi:negative regulator of sigma E activity
MTESTDKPDEQQLDEYLKGDSSVSRQYRQLHSAEVPADLDRVVLRQAEDAVKSRPAQGRPAWVRWTAPLAVAASAVLVVSIVIQTGVRDETAVLQAPQVTMQAKERPLAESKAEGAIVNEQAPAFVPPAEVASEPAAEDKRAGQPRLRRAPVAPPQAAAPAPPSPQAMRSAEPTVEAPETAIEDVIVSSQSAVQDRSAPAAAAPAPPPAIMPVRSVSRAAENAARVLQASSLEESARKQSADAAGEANREEERSLAAQMAYSRQISTPAPVPQQNYTDPEVWLKDIRQLRKDDKQEQADSEWRRFRTAFPNYDVAETDTAREAKK